MLQNAPQDLQSKGLQTRTFNNKSVVKDQELSTIQVDCVIMSLDVRRLPQTKPTTQRTSIWQWNWFFSGGILSKIRPCSFAVFLHSQLFCWVKAGIAAAAVTEKVASRLQQVVFHVQK